MARSGDGLATAELRRVETMTGGLLGKPHDWRPLSPCFVVGCWGGPSVMWLPRGHRAPFQWGGVVLSPATAGQRDAVRCEIGCVTPTHRRPEIPACHCSPITIEQSRTTSSHRLGRLALRRRTPTLLSRQPPPYQSIGCMQSAAAAQVASRGLPRGREILREGPETGKEAMCELCGR